MADVGFAIGPVVDIHAHHIPIGLPDMAARTGDARWPALIVDDDTRIVRGGEVFRRVRSACHDGAVRLAELDAAGVDRQVVSPIPVTLVDWAEPRLAAEYLRALNEGLAELAAGSGGRLLALGAVPLQDPDGAVAELARAVGELAMAGVEIPCMAAGRELDDPALEPFWAAAESEDVPVFVHPAHQRVAIRRTGQPHEFGIGMHTDTALAASALVYGGVLERHPDLRVALAHGCGSFAWSHPRLRYLATLGDADSARADALDALVQRLWVDAIVFDPLHLPLLVERFGADHVMYGTDHPFLPEGFDGPRGVLERGIAAGCGLGYECFGANALAFLGLGHDPP